LKHKSASTFLFAPASAPKDQLKHGHGWARAKGAGGPQKYRKQKAHKARED